MKNIDLKEYIHRNTYQNVSTGYVLTPSALACEMVNTLPESVFISSTTTFLDPICKGGSFIFEIVERLFDHGHSINNIQKRIYTVDYNYHSLNLANNVICQILRARTDVMVYITKYQFIENLYNEIIKIASSNKFKTFNDFLYNLLLDKKDYYLLDMLNDIAKEFIERYEKISKMNSKLFGEVFTPKKLIQEMLDTLPKEVWKNKDLKWLDPAAGINNFFSEVVDRLMVGLSGEIKNDKERYKWIVEEMLYVCELQVKNVFTICQLFDRNNEFKLNVFRGSFLPDENGKCEFDEHMKKVWGIEKFDIIVGNPPYQRESSKAHKLWVEFLDKSKNIANYVLFINPILMCNGRSTNITNIRKSILNHIEYINFSKKDIFDVGEKVCFYLLNLTKNIEYTDVILDDGSKEKRKYDNIIYSHKNEILDSSIIYKIENFSKNNKIDWVSDVKNTDGRGAPKSLTERGIIKKEKDDIYSYEFLHSATQKFFCKDKMSYGKLKIAFNFSGGYYDQSDPDRYMPITKGIIGKQMESVEISDIEEGLRIRDLYSKKLFLFYINKEKTGGFNTGLFKLPKLDWNKSWTDGELYEYFNLTDDEIKLIEDTVGEKKAKRTKKSK